MMWESRSSFFDISTSDNWWKYLYHYVTYKLILRPNSNNIIFSHIFSIVIHKILPDVQGGRMLHDQATMLELKIMLAEMKELLNQQVMCSVHSYIILLN